MNDPSNQDMTFDNWFSKLYEFAVTKGMAPIIGGDKESYREYYDDGDSVEETFYNELGNAD